MIQKSTDLFSLCIYAKKSIFSDAYDTQPVDGDSSDPSSSCSSVSTSSIRPAYAKLESLMDLVPRIGECR